MKAMYLHLCKTHHLFYDGREQLGRFLRGIGLSVEGALAFFQQQFTAKLSVEKFTRQYAYNIRYLYGLEGRRVPLNALPCSVMMKTRPTGQQCHGCPFVYMQDAALEQLLRTLRVREEAIGNIVAYAKEQKVEVGERRKGER
ncbi:uncharacterized protein [Blastocystis hominis]|uniref:DNA primase large subunit C-terminal domain-containing protein n=1 Tax=Blastocystis hominis TaxID=12968 RepID=D8M274_BLAHO|nr:uncharacterized protein [Blastocystis hominis]CBK22163.2 unnamed protein product [Blastocystis hominis]|eukprot:XP_012896211.1 uncharacterized protein [Blastocystis hominis]